VAGSTVGLPANQAVGTLTPVSVAGCPAGKVVLGGGANIVQGNTQRAALASSFPAGATTWNAQAVIVLSGPGSISLTSFVLCSQ
jgi:hypothetical protein